MPSAEKVVGKIQGYEPDELFEVVVETNSDDSVPKYVYVRRSEDSVLVTSFDFGRPPLNCPLSRAAAIVAGSKGECEKVMFETVLENMDQVIDWEDTLNMRYGRRARDSINWSELPLQ
jgi:hypothetical protein